MFGGATANQGLPNGLIRRTQALKSMRRNKHSAPGVRVDQIRDLFRLFDKENKGYVAMDVLEQHLSEVGFQSAREEIRAIIEDVDLDGNGVIDEDEFILMIKTLYGTASHSNEASLPWIAAGPDMSSREIVNSVMTESGATRCGGIVAGVIILAVVATTSLAILSSLPSFADKAAAMDTAQLGVAIVFGLEMAARVYGSPHRSKYWMSVGAVIDIAAILPAALEVVFFLGDSGSQSGWLRLLHVASTLRVLKLTRYFAQARLLMEVVELAHMPLVMAMFISGVGVLSMGIAVFSVECDHWSDAANACLTSDHKRSDFQSLLDGLYWAITTISTVGYGDVVPQTVAGRVIATFASLLGILLLSFPISVFSVNFQHLYRIFQHRERLRNEMTHDLLLELFLHSELTQERRQLERRPARYHQGKLYEAMSRTVHQVNSMLLKSRGGTTATISTVQPHPDLPRLPPAAVQPPVALVEAPLRGVEGTPLAFAGSGSVLPSSGRAAGSSAFAAEATAAPASAAAAGAAVVTPRSVQDVGSPLSSTPNSDTSGTGAMVTPNQGIRPRGRRRSGEADGLLLRWSSRGSPSPHHEPPGPSPEMPQLTRDVRWYMEELDLIAKQKGPGAPPPPAAPKATPPLRRVRTDMDLQSTINDTRRDSSRSRGGVLEDISDEDDDGDDDGDVPSVAAAIRSSRHAATAPPPARRFKTMPSTVAVGGQQGASGGRAVVAGGAAGTAAGLRAQQPLLGQGPAAERQGSRRLIHSDIEPKTLHRLRKTFAAFTRIAETSSVDDLALTAESFVHVDLTNAQELATAAQLLVMDGRTRAWRKIKQRAMSTMAELEADVERLVERVRQEELEAGVQAAAGVDDEADEDQGAASPRRGSGGSVRSKRSSVGALFTAARGNPSDIEQARHLSSVATPHPGRTRGFEFKEQAISP